MFSDYLHRGLNIFNAEKEDRSVTQWILLYSLVFIGCSSLESHKSPQILVQTNTVMNYIDFKN